MRAHGIIVALHTPLTPSGEIHEEALRDHLEWMVQSGIHGIFPCGTMGEGIALSDAQRRRVAEITVDQVKSRAFVMPQVTTNNTAGCIELSRHAKAAGADAISVIAPYFYPSDGPALDAFFSEIAAAVRELFEGYVFRAQQNTRYVESDTMEATVTHVLDTLISRLTSADIQSTITPDEGRNVPWHYNNVAAVDTAKQSLVGMDGLREMVKVDRENAELRNKVRELKERAVLFLEAMIADGGYFAGVEEAYFVDSGEYPETNDDGIVRHATGGVAEGTIVMREADYLAPVCHHFGENNLPAGVEKPCHPIGGCTLCNAEKIPYTDELDPTDNVNVRLAQTAEHREKGLITPEVEWAGDGIVVVTMFLPAPAREAEAAALELAEAMNLEDPEVIHARVRADGAVITRAGAAACGAAYGRPAQFGSHDRQADVAGAGRRLSAPDESHPSGIRPADGRLCRANARSTSCLQCKPSPAARCPAPLLRRVRVVATMI